MLIGVLSTVVGGLLAGESANSAPAARAEAELASGVLQDGHVAALGREMFGNYWIAVQAGGLLLLAALVGASAIVSGGRSRTASDADRRPPEDQPRAEEH
jgi:NADH:ubiquinone oxidoreductase subunit 6 (subunit J)